MEVEIKNYLKFIRKIGIKAWIPGLPGSGPKMSVADQCRSGVLCLNYKGSDIYIQGNSRRAANNGKSSTGFVCKNPDHNMFVPEKTGVQFRRIVTEKLTKEVRVAKCYVSSLSNYAPNHYGSGNAASMKNSFCHLHKKATRSDYAGKFLSSLDSKRRRLPEIEKSGLSPGFVQQLIKRFDVYDNVEQSRPSRKTL